MPKISVLTPVSAISGTEIIPVVQSGVTMSVTPNKLLTLPDTTTSETGVIYKAANRFIHTFHHPTGGGAIPAGENTFLGINAGNFTMGSTATLSTQASYNTVIGVNSLQANTTGHQNTIVGVNGLYSNTAGYYNTGIGVNSLQANTTGQLNSAVGRTSLYSNTTGYQNTSIGANSGRYIADGITANATGNNGVYLGYDTRANGDGETNQIVIGASAIGNGSNSVTLGNDSITKTMLKGNVGIGTTPTCTLHVGGAVRTAGPTVGTLSSAISVGAGARCWVTDSTVAYIAANIGSVVVGGGSEFAPVYSDGSSWKIG